MTEQAQPTGSPTMQREELDLPAGWKLVPVEPTPEMHLAAWNACDRTNRAVEPNDFWAAYNGGIYRAMLAAAPSPEAEP